MAFYSLFKFLIMCSLVISCNIKDETISSQKCSPSYKDDSKLIIGSNDWISFDQTGDEVQNQNELTVAQIKIPTMMASCTGFLINEDTIMTNNHCISSASRAANVTALFRNLDGSRTVYSCSQFITTNLFYDFTLIKCQDSPGQKYGWVGLINKLYQNADTLGGSSGSPIFSKPNNRRIY